MQKSRLQLPQGEERLGCKFYRTLVLLPQPLLGEEKLVFRIAYRNTILKPMNIPFILCILSVCQSAASVIPGQPFFTLWCNCSILKHVTNEKYHSNQSSC